MIDSLIDPADRQALAVINGAECDVSVDPEDDEDEGDTDLFEHGNPVG